MSAAERHNSAQPAPIGWRSRGYLPHFDGGDGLPQSVTFRLADSVPAKVIDRWGEELQAKPLPEREVELRKLIEKYLDAGYGACHLRDPRIGALVEDALLCFDGIRYRVWSWGL